MDELDSLTLARDLLLSSIRAVRAGGAYAYYVPRAKTMSPSGCPEQYIELSMKCGVLLYKVESGRQQPLSAPPPRQTPLSHNNHREGL